MRYFTYYCLERFFLVKSCVMVNLLFEVASSPVLMVSATVAHPLEVVLNSGNKEILVVNLKSLFSDPYTIIR